MKLTMQSEDLRCLAGILGEMEDVIVSPRNGVIIAHDYSGTRRIQYEMPKEDEDDYGLNSLSFAKVSKRIRDVCQVQFTKNACILQSNNLTYNLRPFVAPKHKKIQKTEHSGEVTIKAKDMITALGDLKATSSTTAVIAIQDDTVRFQGIGAFDSDITVPTKHYTGVGYSRLDLNLLLPCARHMMGDITISLSPKKPTKMQFGNYTYHQAAMT